jgi:hypothetical protein
MDVIERKVNCHIQPSTLLGLELKFKYIDKINSQFILICRPAGLFCYRQNFRIALIKATKLYSRVGRNPHGRRWGVVSEFCVYTRRLG